MKIKFRRYTYAPLLLALAMMIGALNPQRALCQTAPYKFDIGAAIGTSGYIGEANSANLFSHPGFVGEGRFGYIMDSRWTLRANLSVLTLSGSTSDMENVLPDNAVYDFSSTVYDLGARIEFNFFPYGIGETYKRLRRWTPYLALGIGGSLASSEGQSAATFNIPMAFGFKYKPAERWNLFAEFSMTKTFSDKIDGPNLNNINGIKISFYKNTDWYSRITIGVTYEFGKRCETCHYLD